MKIDIAKFEELLQLVNPLIKKKDKVMREATSTQQRLLSITLHYLATGNTFKDLKLNSAISTQALGIIVMETCLGTSPYTWLAIEHNS